MISSKNSTALWKTLSFLLFLSGTDSEGRRGERKGSPNVWCKGLTTEGCSWLQSLCRQVWPVSYSENPLQLFLAERLDQSEIVHGKSQKPYLTFWVQAGKELVALDGTQSCLAQLCHCRCFLTARTVLKVPVTETNGPWRDSPFAQR